MPLIKTHPSIKIATDILTRMNLERDLIPPLFTRPHIIMLINEPMIKFPETESGEEAPLKKKFSEFSV